MNGNVDTDDFTPDNPSVDVVGKLSFKEKIGYGLGDTASNLYWKLFENFQLIFYTDVFGISAAAAATMFFVTKLWDAMNDPLVGFLADRTKTAWGRFRPYLIWGSVPFAVTGILTFYTPDFSPTGKLVYAYHHLYSGVHGVHRDQYSLRRVDGSHLAQLAGTYNRFDIPICVGFLRRACRSEVYRALGQVFRRQQGNHRRWSRPNRHR